MLFFAIRRAVFHVSQQDVLVAQLPANDAPPGARAAVAEARLRALNLRDPEQLLAEFRGGDLEENLVLQAVDDEEAFFRRGFLGDDLVVAKMTRRRK